MKAKIYFMGKFIGTEEIDPNSLCGQFLRGNFALGVKKLDKMKKDLEKIPGTKVSIGFEIKEEK